MVQRHAHALVKGALAWLLLGLSAGPLFAAEALVLPLWPQGAPEPAGFIPGPENTVPPRDGRQRRLINVAVPTITVYRPPHPNGTAVVVAPGGAYEFLAIEHEGTEVCERLVPLGITCVLLRYRVPSRTPGEPGREALQDAQRAMGLVKRHAAQWGVNPDRVGFLGFSAGGHLAIRLALQAAPRSYAFDRSLDVDDVTPSFLIPVYPAYLVDKDSAQQLRDDIRVTPQAPPLFLVHAHDDDTGASSSVGSALLYLAYKRAGRPAELHIYAKGGHGFGLKSLALPTADWLTRVVDWMGAMGWMKP